MTAQEILDWYESEGDGSIYGYMYGSPWIYNGSYEEWRRDELIEWKKSELELGRNRDCFCVVWGWPGPDYNIYKFRDYGITWAFTEGEIATDTKMVKNSDGSWTLVREGEHT